VTARSRSLGTTPLDGVELPASATSVLLRKAGEREWREVEPTHGYTGNSRGVGTADMARALRDGRPHRAGGALAYHVLDIMHAFHDASDSGAHVALESTCERPAPLPAGVKDGELD